MAYNIYRLYRIRKNMTTVQENRSKFRHVLDELVMQIYNGALESGSPLYSRQELCRKYDLSPMTAHRVQSELQKLGLLTARPGQGFIIHAPRLIEPEGFAPLRRVVTIGGRNAIGPGTIHGERIMAGIAEECARNGLEHIIEYVNLLENRQGFINTRRQLKADEGLSLFLGPSLLPEVISLLLTPKLRVSLINESMPGHISVRCDIRHGVRTVLDVFKRSHCRRVILGAYFSSFHPGINESEFIETFEECCPELGLAFHVCISGNYHELVHICEEFHADAVFFSTEMSAHCFLRSCMPALSGKPLIAAIGPSITGQELPDDFGMIVYEPDLEEMGRASVRQLLEYKTPLQAVRNVRIRGTLRKSKPIQIKGD